MLVVVYLTGSTALDFLNSIHKVYLCQGDHTVEAYSSWGRTKALYGLLITAFLLKIKVLETFANVLKTRPLFALPRHYTLTLNCINSNHP